MTQYVRHNTLLSVIGVVAETILIYEIAALGIFKAEDKALLSAYNYQYKSVFEILTKTLNLNNIVEAT